MQRRDSGLPTGARPLDPDLHFSNTVPHSRTCGTLSGLLRGKRSALARTLETYTAGGTGGVSAEIGFRIFASVYDYLDAPISRVTGADVPVPASPVLEKAALPDKDRIVQAAVDLVARES